jgi:hypothetical protein
LKELDAYIITKVESSKKIPKMASIEKTLLVLTNQFGSIIVVGMVLLIGKIGNYLMVDIDNLISQFFNLNSK